MALPLPDARLLSDEVLEALRLRAIRARQLGYSEAAIADFLGVCRETVSRWWSAYQAGGEPALPHDRTGRPRGSGRLLDDDQAAHLQQLIDTHTPEQVGLAAPLWNRRAVRELIRQECGVVVALRTVSLYLRRWGYTLKKPRRHARDQNPAAVRAWLRQTYPAIRARAFHDGAEIHWCDETGVAADAHPGYGYARVGQPATVEVPDSHLRVNLISTITNTGKVQFMTYHQTMTAALFITFLQQLIRSSPRKIYLIADRLRAHTAAEVQAWLVAHREEIAVYYLPTHSPELNPDEYLNNDLKGTVNAAGWPHNKTELQERVEGFLNKLKQIPEHIMSYFQNPHVHYATAINL